MDDPPAHFRRSLAVINRQTDFARRKFVKSFFDSQLRSLDFAIFVASLNRYRPFHRRLPIAASLKSAIFMKLSWLMFPIPSHRRLFAALHPVRQVAPSWEMIKPALQQSAGQ
jgi:hypothetical protein